MQDVLQLLKDLVSIDSTNPDLVPGGAGEGAVAAFVANWLRSRGLEVHVQEVLPGRPNVIGIARGNGAPGGKSLMLNAHTDVVGSAGMAAPFTPRVADGKLYGRGAYDMKCGLAASMAAAAEAKQLDLRGDVIVTAVMDEEYAGLGTADIVKRWKADAAIVTEPNQLQLSVAHKGFVWLEIETHGVAAHGSRPDLGVDAIAMMGGVLTGLQQLDRDLRANPTHPLLKSGSLHASLISGGRELSSYPDKCVLAVERRTIPGETTAIVEAQARAILDRLAAQDPDFKADIRITLDRPPFAVAHDAAIVTTLRAHATRVLGRAPDLVGETPWMDSATLSAAGIPTVIFGPIGTGAHALEEWVDIQSVQHCAQALLDTAEEFCK